MGETESEGVHAETVAFELGGGVAGTKVEGLRHTCWEQIQRTDRNPQQVNGRSAEKVSREGGQEFNAGGSRAGGERGTHGCPQLAADIFKIRHTCLT